MTLDTVSSSSGSSLAERSVLAASTLTAGYLLCRCMTPPNPLRIESAKDSPGSRLMIPAFSALTIYRGTLFASSILTSLVALHGPPFEKTFTLGSANLNHYVHSGQMNATLFTLNPISAIVLAAIALGAGMRLRAMKKLGRSFTFDLHEPEGLVTDGIYQYVQHPSYTFGFLAFVPANTWLMRVDGPLGAILPPQLFQSLLAWQTPWHVLATCLTILGVVIRVRDEERMLKAEFGKEWSEWHRKTARFIPFLF